MSPAAALAPEPTMLVESALLGALEAPADALITFPTGLVGMPQYRTFVLVDAPREGMYWLQSVDEPGLTFLLADPFPRVPGYAVHLTPDDVGALHAARADDIAVLAIITLPARRGDAATANLQAPLALNFAARLGRQLVIPESEYGVREVVEIG
jgi:flagellar assembly factor FliW